MPSKNKKKPKNEILDSEIDESNTRINFDVLKYTRSPNWNNLKTKSLTSREGRERKESKASNNFPISWDIQEDNSTKFQKCSTHRPSKFNSNFNKK